MNKSKINELSAQTEADRNSTAQNPSVSQPNANTNVVGIPFKSREIKFRAWNIVTKTMIDLKKITPLALNMDTNGLFIPFSDGLPIMQYTGLKDKNGKEIYEGDIVKWGHIEGGEEDPVRIALVVWKNDIQFHILNYKMDYAGQNKVFHFGSFIYSNTEKWMEVLGNCFENPTLLEW